MFIFAPSDLNNKFIVYLNFLVELNDFDAHYSRMIREIQSQRYFFVYKKAKALKLK